MIDLAKYKIIQASTCGTCAHFRRHYVLRDDDWFFPLDYGHCVYPRCKKREPDQTCPHWTPKP